jgi:hypothetical protein
VWTPFSLPERGFCSGYPSHLRTENSGTENGIANLPKRCDVVIETTEGVVMRYFPKNIRVSKEIVCIIYEMTLVSVVSPVRGLNAHEGLETVVRPFILNLSTRWVRVFSFTF